MKLFCVSFLVNGHEQDLVFHFGPKRKATYFPVAFFELTLDYTA